MTVQTLGTIKSFIKQEILIDRLELEVESAEEIDENAGLFADNGLGLDSVESLEVMSSLENKYAVRFKNYPDDVVRGAFVTVASIAALVEAILAGNLSQKI